MGTAVQSKLSRALCMMILHMIYSVRKVSDDIWFLDRARATAIWPHWETSRAPFMHRVFKHELHT